MMIVRLAMVLLFLGSAGLLLGSASAEYVVDDGCNSVTLDEQSLEAGAQVGVCSRPYCLPVQCHPCIMVKPYEQL